MGWRSGQSYSQDLRDRVLGAVDGGMAVRRAAATFGVSVSYIYKALIRRRLTGDSGINPNRGHHPRKLRPEQEVALAAYALAPRDHARAGAGLAIGRAWRRAQHRRHLERGASVIGGVARRQDKAEWPPDDVHERMDLGCTTAPRDADGVLSAPPFAPPAHRWTLM